MVQYLAESIFQLSNFGEPFVSYPPPGCACCGFTNALLHTSVVTGGYFSLSCSSFSL